MIRMITGRAPAGERPPSAHMLVSVLPYPTTATVCMWITTMTTGVLMTIIVPSGGGL